VISAEWHPDDERLLTRYLDDAGQDPSLEAHLARCRSCVRRLDALTAALDDWRASADAMANEAFDAPRLAAQRRAIQKRLGAAVPARVLSFPMPGQERHAPLARVAAAVLLVALAGAGVFRVLQTPEAPAQQAFRAAQGRMAVPVRYVRDAVADAALEDIDLALVRPRTPELQALDAFTPHVRDVAVVLPVR
jgi:anti-sigma factor RsiW